MSNSNDNDAIDTIIKQWQQQFPKLESQHMALIGRIQRCADLLTPKLDKVFEHYGLHKGDFDVLATLRRSGEPYCLSPTELFSSLMVTSGTMTTRLNSMQKRGLIERLPNINDARSNLVKLTDKGKNLIDEAVFLHVENEKTILEKLPTNVKQRLEADLKLLESLLLP